MTKDHKKTISGKQFLNKIQALTQVDKVNAKSSGETLCIKHCKNRKLYTKGRYLNLTNIIDFIKSGQKIEVKDYDGTIVTKQVLRQALSLLDFEETTLVELIKNYSK
jgi:polyhydroxyalkanoate synthesis regulator protein